MLYVPVSLVIVADTIEVAVLVAVMLTPGIKARAASKTVPLRVALLDWPSAGAGRLGKRSATAMTKNFFIGILLRLRAGATICSAAIAESSAGRRALNCSMEK